MKICTNKAIFQNLAHFQIASSETISWDRKCITGILWETEGETDTKPEGQGKLYSPAFTKQESTLHALYFSTLIKP